MIRATAEPIAIVAGSTTFTHHVGGHGGHTSGGRHILAPHDIDPDRKAAESQSWKDGSFDDSDVLVNSDGRSYYVKAGTGVELKPGESITLWPHQYHDFDVKEGTGDVLIGEVSMCNDDNTDNRFYEEVGRFPEIEEDEKPYRLLCNEYPKK